MNKLLIVLLTSLVALLHVATAAESSVRASNGVGPKELESTGLELVEDEVEDETEAADLWNRILHRRTWWWGVVRRPDIVDTAIDAGLTTLVDFVVQAGLEDVLRGDGPLTVFAPTNEAFAALPAGVVDTLTTDMDALQYVLLYHVLPGDSVITYGNTWRGGGPHTTATANNATVTTARYRAGRTGPLVSMVNNARVEVPNVRASNGVVHVIDKVLVPPRQDPAEVPAGTTLPAETTPPAPAPATETTAPTTATPPAETTAPTPATA